MIYKIYCLKDQNGEIRYVGYTTLSAARRMCEHRHSHPERKGYTFHVIDVFDNKREALEAERFYINLLSPPENVAPGQGYPASLVEGRKVSHKRASKRVYCPELEQYFPSVNQAASDTGSNRNHVKDCCLGRRNTTNGYHFQYAGETVEERLNGVGTPHANTEVNAGTKEPTSL